MIGNYLTIALRNIVRHKLYSFINIVGLTIGLTCAILIILFVRDELSWDRWLPGSRDLYRLSTTLAYPGRSPQHFAITAYPLLQTIKDHVPEVVGATHILPEDITIGVGNKRFFETAHAVDPGFFQVIGLPFVEGSAERIFDQPNSVVLSQSWATKYFGTAEPLGKVITVSGLVCPTPKSPCQTFTRPLIVRGIIRDLPHNSQLDLNILYPTTSVALMLTTRQRESWLFLSGFSYVSLAPGSDAAAVAQKVNDAIDRFFDVRKAVNLKMRPSAFEHIRLTQFWDVHLSDEKFAFDMTQAGDREIVYGISAIAVLVLLVAAFNYTNLAVAQSTLRAREIALRKCVGANRKQIAFQFLGESLLLTFLSLVLALSIAETVLPVFGRVLGRPLHLSYLADWPLLLSFVAMAALVGILSGSYPALILSCIKPAVSLRKDGHFGRRAGVFRTAMIAAQFAVSIGLGIVTITVFTQSNFERTLDLGFRHDNVLVVYGSGLSSTTRDAFVRALRSLPSVQDVAVSTTAPFEYAVIGSTHVHVPGNAQDFVVIPMRASPEYPQLYKMRLLAGRLLSRQHDLDLLGSEDNTANKERNILINESAARLFGFAPDRALGRSLILADGATVNIVGVLGDAQTDGPARSVAPTIFYDDPNSAYAISVKVKNGQTESAVASIDTLWKAMAPEAAMQLRFLGQDFQAQFADLERRGVIFGIFVSIVIAIASLGLFGVAAFSVDRRAKEIGIRKIFGANASDIVRMLMRQFSAPVFIASLIAWPMAYLYLRHWLEQYPHRVSLSPENFIAATFIAFLIASGTVLVHARRAAKAHPIHALRCE